MTLIKSHEVDKRMNLRYSMKNSDDRHGDNILIEDNIIEIFESTFEKYGIVVKDSINVYHDYTIVAKYNVSTADMDIAYHFLDCICKSFGLQRMTF